MGAAVVARSRHRLGILGPAACFATCWIHMSTILDKIIATKRQEVAERKPERPIELLHDEIAALGRPRNFFQAVTRKASVKGAKPLNLIAEIKKASPSDAGIRADFDPVAIAEVYAANGADALGV